MSGLREFTYRGVPIEQLVEMPMDKFILLLPARQRRSLRRGLSPSARALLERVRKAKKMAEASQKAVVKTYNRDMIILPEMVGLTISVYDGKQFLPIDITPEMLGHYLGEYIITCKRVQHGAPGLRATRSSMYIPLK